LCSFSTSATSFETIKIHGKYTFSEELFNWPMDCKVVIKKSQNFVEAHPRGEFVPGGVRSAF
jgi:hypothetical protein